MLKEKLQKYVPTVETLQEYRVLKVFGKALFSHNLWHLNRHSVSRAFLVGIFSAWIPVPFQMVIAAGLAILTRSNLPVSIALVWITNPLTMPPLFYFAYKVGTVILDVPAQDTFNINLAFKAIMHIFTGDVVNGWHTFTSMLKGTWKPFLLGSAICGVVFSISGYFGIKAVWRHFTIKHWKERKLRRQVKNLQTTQDTQKI